MEIELQNFFDEFDLRIEESEHTLNEIERVIFTGRYHLDTEHLAIFSVQTIAMIYSIWEGFIQKTFSDYLSTLNKLNIPFQDYQNSIIVFQMESKFKQFREYPEKLSKRIKFLSDLQSHYQSDRILLDTSINTESNVSFDVLNKIMNQFSLEEFPERWGDDYNYPNPTLKEEMNTFLDYRNGVAHGGDISSIDKVTQQVFDRYKQLVLALMHEIRDRLYIGADSKHYLKGDKKT